MKKRTLQKLTLNKKAISSLEHASITGAGEGTRRTDCTICCWIDETYPCGLSLFIDC
ncbi:class I lanthipeptide [uncultured Kordia sp.]|uniref:class I lanthipeptide n=1 Tax=uncultured Kordia sp. TaxID=507699 RepID=UPI00262F87F6|nr:class I lanthipeptide [uncultured Kordia sp.]